MSVSRELLPVLMSEKRNGIKGGIYNKMQVDFAYNSNHIEGSRLSHEQTRYMKHIIYLCFKKIICHYYTINSQNKKSH